MELKTFFKPTIATLYFIIFSASLFLLGYGVGGIKKSVSERDKIIYPFLLTFVLPGASFLNLFINQQIEGKNKEYREKKEAECENKVKDYANNYLRELGHLEIELRKLDGPVVIECLEKTNYFREIVRNYVKNYEASQNVVKWLDIEKKRVLLVEVIVAKALRKNPNQISDLQTFNQDIGRCINWLRDSIDVLHSRPIYPPEMTKALQALENNFKPYEDALESILEVEELQLQSNYTGILEQYVHELIERLKAYCNQRLKNPKMPTRRD